MIKYDIFQSVNVSDKKYARVVDQTAVTSSEMARNIASGSTFKEHEVLPVLEYLYQEMEKALKDGKSVHLKGLGFFSLQIKGEVVTNANGSDMLRDGCVSDIRFRPEQQYLDRFEKIELRRYKRKEKGVTVLTDEEILQAAARLTEQENMFTPAQLEGALHLHRNQVYRLLKRLVGEGRLEKLSYGTRSNFYRVK